MEARTKTIEAWFNMIEEGQIVLPRFQRHEAWRRKQVEDLFFNILRKPVLPIGTLLILEVQGEEPFLSRPIVGAPEKGSVTMHLLDGQQRMTALWRALNGLYEDQKLFVAFNRTAEEDAEDDAQPRPDVPAIQSVQSGKWTQDAGKTFERGLLPLACLRPGSTGEKTLETWLQEVRAAGHEPGPQMGRIYDWRQRVAGYGIPFLALPSGTGRETALNVFIRMNTSATPLKDFDIVVAQMEEASGDSLHDFVEEIRAEQPAAKDFGRIEELVLRVAALVAGQPALKKSYLDTHFGQRLAENRQKVKQGIVSGLAFLQDEGIFNNKLVPSEPAVYLVCALWAEVERLGSDAEGFARSFLRKVLWRACVVERYGKTAATRAYTDHRVLVPALLAGDMSPDCLLFDTEQFGLPQVQDIVNAGWPGRSEALPRATLALALRHGGKDFATGKIASPGNFWEREYHHIVPIKALGLSRDDPRANRAMNCARINWQVNRQIAGSEPSDYIAARAEAAALGEADVRERLDSHLISYDALMKDDYGAFIDDRAHRFHNYLVALCDGRVRS